MKRLALALLAFVFAAMASPTAVAQTPGDNSEKALLEALSKKIDEQNAKIDILSQQILKLEQQVAKVRPGVMIGETPSPPVTHSATTEAPKATTPAPQSGSSHVVAKGETLTSIAKMHKVSVDELKKFNRIENERTLQIGQTILIPSSASSPGASPSASPTSG